MLLLLGFGHSNAQYGPVVSFTYDDGSDTWYDTGFPLFQEYGFPGVVYINATNSWVQWTGTIDKLLEMQAAGWEISSHTYDHNGIEESNVSPMKDWLDVNGFPNSGFGAPNNIWDHRRVNIIKRYHPYYAGFYTSEGGISQPFDIYFLQRYSLTNRDNIQAIIQKLDDAVANNKWIIFYAHAFGGTYGNVQDGWYQSDSLLRLVFNEIVARGIPVKTVREVITDLYPPGCVIECSEDTQQVPVLTYFEEGGGSFSTSVWNEYWHNISQTGPRYTGSPVVYCHTSNDSLPVMKFYRNVPNGEYEVRATIIEYDPIRTYRLYYSFDSVNTAQYNVEVDKNSDVSLGTVTITDGQFALYTQKADAVSGGDGYVGWAFIRLRTTAPNFITANIKVFLEGPYNGSGAMTTTLNADSLIPRFSSTAYSTVTYGYTASTVASIPNSNIVDWVLVELRTGTEATTMVGRRAAFLKSDGSIVDLDGLSQVRFKGITPGNYYIVIRHRNHLAIMSANPISLNSTNSLLYDFSNAQTQAFGTNAMKDLGGGIYGIYSAEGNGDGFISASDKNIIWFPNNGFSGYLKGDFNLNGFVTAGDKNLFWFPNNGLSSQVP